MSGFSVENKFYLVAWSPQSGAEPPEQTFDGYILTKIIQSKRCKFASWSNTCISYHKRTFARNNPFIYNSNMFSPQPFL